MRAAGDGDGDGTADLLGGRAWTVPSGTAGGNWLILGSPIAAGGGSRSVTTVDRAFHNPVDTADGSLPPATASAGDIDGGGLGDLLLGSFQVTSAGFAYAGRAWLLYIAYEPQPAPATTPLAYSAPATAGGLEEVSAP